MKNVPTVLAVGDSNRCSRNICRRRKNIYGMWSAIMASECRPNDDNARLTAVGRAKYLTLSRMMIAAVAPP